MHIHEVFFPQDEYTRTKIQYKSAYGKAACTLLAVYLYGTGLSWKGSIGSIKIVIENNLPYSIIQAITMEDHESIKNRFERTADNKYELELIDVEPEKLDATFEIELSDVIDNTGPRAFPANFRWNKRIVDTSEFKWYRRDQLRLVRNTVYALHGYAFTSEDLRHFLKALKTVQTGILPTRQIKISRNERTPTQGVRGIVRSHKASQSGTYLSFDPKVGVCTLRTNQHCQKLKGQTSRIYWRQRKDSGNPI